MLYKGKQAEGYNQHMDIAYNLPMYSERSLPKIGQSRYSGFWKVLLRSRNTAMQVPGKDSVPSYERKNSKCRQP